MSKIHIVNDYYPEQDIESTDMACKLLRRMQKVLDDIDFCLLYAQKYNISIDIPTQKVFNQLKRNVIILSMRLSCSTII